MGGSLAAFLKMQNKTHTLVYKDKQYRFIVFNEGILMKEYLTSLLKYMKSVPLIGMLLSPSLFNFSLVCFLFYMASPPLRVAFLIILFIQAFVSECDAYDLDLRDKKNIAEELKESLEDYRHGQNQVYFEMVKWVKLLQEMRTILKKIESQMKVPEDLKPEIEETPKKGRSKKCSTSL